MNIFIDTNILLDLYHMSGPDLDELLKIVKLAKNNKLNVLMSEQVCSEFWRNRERVVAEALKLFSNSKISITLPNIIRSNPRSVEIRKIEERFNTLIRELKNDVDIEIQNHKLKADEVIDALFKQCPCRPVSCDIIVKSKKRVELGNPPGKLNSIGDAINWEWLLDILPEYEDLIIISSDSDFESELLPNHPKEYLKREWSNNLYRGELYLFKSLSSFLRKYFPDIKLSGEIDKAIALERLENSMSFKATHKAISTLQNYDDFTDIEIKKIIDAYSLNRQIYSIIGDEDVNNFANKIIRLIKTDSIMENAEKLQNMLSQIDSPHQDQDDFPF